MMSEIDVIAKYFQSVGVIAPGIMIDVGAHVGSTALPFARKGWQVFCFEPEPVNYAELCGTLDPYHSVKCIPLAVSNLDQNAVPFYVSKEHWGIHTLKPFHETHRASLQVKTIRLATFLAEQSIAKLDFLKVDVEGADFLVLQGMDWDRWQPQVVMTEFMDSRTIPGHGYSFKDVHQYMKDRGYSCLVFDYESVNEYSRKENPGRDPKLLKIAMAQGTEVLHQGNAIYFKCENEALMKQALISARLEMVRQRVFHRARLVRDRMPQSLKKIFRPLKNMIQR